MAVEKKWIDSKRAYWSNNTIDTNEVKKYYQFTYPPTKVLRILFIGRLIPSKKVDVAIKYFELLQKKFSNKILNWKSLVMVLHQNLLKLQ